MTWFLFAILAIGSIAVHLWSEHAEANRRARSFANWQAAARTLGLHFSGAESGSADDTRSITGVLNGAPVRADFRREVVRTGKNRKIVDKTTVGSGGPGRIPATLSLRRDSTFRSLGRFVQGGEDKKIGDEPFDEAVEVSEMDAWVCAALSEEARQQLADLLSRGGEIRDGTLWLETTDAAADDPAWLPGMLQFFAQLGQRLTVTSDSLHQRLAHNAMHDRSPSVRLQNFQFLAEPSTATLLPLLISTARELLADDHVPVRLAAAVHLDSEGSSVLDALACNPRVETALRVQALRELGARGGPGLELLLTKLLGSSSPELVCAALAIIAARHLEALSAAVVKCAANEHAEVRVAAATALGSLAANAAEPVLIRLLSDSSSEVQRASAESLGRVGSVAAVEPLLPLAERLGRAQLRQAARGAIGRIQSRLGNVEAGSLSLADDHELAGALDIAEEPAAVRIGQVSLADDADSEQDPRARASVTPPDKPHR